MDEVRGTTGALEARPGPIPSRPSRIWRRHGSWTKSSFGGKGMWRKKPMRTSGGARAASAGPAAAGSRGPTRALRERPPRRRLRRSGGSPADRRPTSAGGTPAARSRRGRAARECRCRSPRSSPRTPAGSAEPGAGRRARRGSTSSAESMPPSHPIQAPPLFCRIGSSAVTRPPGDLFQLTVPSSSTTRSTGSRFATTTRS